jgi:hypothetical protein
MPEFDLDGLDLAPDDRRGPGRPAPLHLSGDAANRWRCLDALSAFCRPQAGPIDDRLQSIKSWMSEGLPLGRLSTPDQQRFLATVLWNLDGLDVHEIRHERHLHDLAVWLVRTVGFRDREWLRNWHHSLPRPIPDDVIQARRECVQALAQEFQDFA